MKKSLRVLSLVLAVVMIFSCVSVAASATYRGSASAVKSAVTYDDVNTAVYTTEQYAEMALDEVDRMLTEANLGVIDIYVTTLDLSSIDGALAGIESALKSVDSLLGYLGDAAALKTPLGYLNGVRRTSGTNPNTNVIYKLLDVIGGVAPVAQKYVTGDISLGILQSFISSYVFDVEKLAYGMLIQVAGLGGEDFNYFDSINEQATINLVDNYQAKGLIALGQKVFNKYILGEWKQLDDPSNWLFYDATHKTNVNAYDEIIWLDASGNDVSNQAMDTDTYDYYAWVHPDCWVTKGLGNGVRVAAGTKEAPAESYAAVNFVTLIGNNTSVYDFVEKLFVQAYNGILVPVLNRITTRWINGERGYYINESKTEQYLKENGETKLDSEGKAIPNADFDYMYIGDDLDSDPVKEATSSAFTLFDTKITVPYYTLTKADGTGSYSTFVAAFNDNLGTFASTVLRVTENKDAASGNTHTYYYDDNKSCEFTWTYGDNSTNLVNNVCSVLKFLLHATGQEFFDSGIIERGEYKDDATVDALTNQELLSYVLRGVMNANVPYVYIPENNDTKTLAGVCMQACVQLAYQDVPENTYTIPKHKNYTTEEEYVNAVVDKCLTILMDVAAYNLNAVLDTNLDDSTTDSNYSASNTGLLSYQGDSGSWENAAKTIAAWAVYTWASTDYGSGIKCLLNLDFKSDDKAGKTTGLTVNDVWSDLDTLVNSIVPIKGSDTWLASAISSNTYVMKSLIFDYIVYPVLNLNVSKLETILSENSEGALAKNNVQTILIDTVHRVFDLLFPDVFSHKVTTLDSFLNNTTLSTMVYDLISTLSADYDVTGQTNGGTIYGRGKILTGVALPIVCMILGLSDKQEFKELENYIPSAVSAGGNIEFSIYNGSKGVNTRYRDTQSFKSIVDELYSYEITSYTATSLIKNSTPTIAPKDGSSKIVAGGAYKAYTITGAEAGDMLQIIFKYKVKDENGAYIQINGSEAELSSTSFCYVGASDKGDDETLVTEDLGNDLQLQYATDIYLDSGDSLSDLANYTFRIKDNKSGNHDGIAVTLDSINLSGTTQGWAAIGTTNDENSSITAGGATYVYNPFKANATFKRAAYTYEEDTDGSTKYDDYDKPVRSAYDTEDGKTIVVNGTYTITTSFTVGGTSHTITTRVHLYDDYGLESLVNSCISANRSIDNLSNPSSEATKNAWSAYYTALQNAASLALQPNNNTHDSQEFDAYIGLTNAGKAAEETSNYVTYYNALYAATQALKEYETGSDAASLWNYVNEKLPYNYSRASYTVKDEGGNDVTVYYQKQLEYNDSNYKYIGQRNYLSHTYRTFKSYVKEANSLISKEYKWFVSPEDYAELSDEEKLKKVESYQNDVSENTETISAVQAAYVMHMLDLTYSRLISKDASANALTAVLSDAETFKTVTSTNYTADSYANFEAAKNFAITAKTSKNAEMITRAITEYIDAWKKLVKQADYSNLESAVEAAFTSVYVFTDETTLADNEVTYAAVVKKGEFVPINATNYGGIELDPDEPDYAHYYYTEATFNAFLTALNNAAQLLVDNLNGNALGQGQQTTIDDADTALRNAQAALVVYTDGGDSGGDETKEVTWSLDEEAEYEGLNGEIYSAAIDGDLYGEIQLSEITYEDETYNITGVLYGIPGEPAEEDIKAMFNVENGTVEVTENSEGNYGTGSYVFIKDSNNNVKAVYFVAYRGDLNGDLNTDTNDSTYLMYAIAGMEGYLYENGSTEESVLMAAADVDGDHSLTPNDIQYITYQNAARYAINQSDGSVTEF
jgi:hypothetical protein